MPRVIRLKKGASLKKLQDITYKIYGTANDRSFNTWDLFSNLEKFTMRALKGVRKKDKEKIRFNLVIAVGWLMALMNRFHVNLETAVWKRFPYKCSYCGQVACACKKKKPKKRPDVLKPTRKKPKNLKQFQSMFEKIYPSNRRSLDHAGIHLSEELGELSESIQAFFGTHNNKYFKIIVYESADFFSCLMGVFNSAGIDFEKAMLEFYSHNCHECKKAPCVCHFNEISEYES